MFRELILGLAASDAFSSNHLMIYHVKLRYCAVFLKQDKSWIIHYSIWKESSDNMATQSPGRQRSLGTREAGHSALPFSQGWGGGHSASKGLDALGAQ